MAFDADQGAAMAAVIQEARDLSPAKMERFGRLLWDARAIEQGGDVVYANSLVILDEGERAALAGLESEINAFTEPMKLDDQYRLAARTAFHWKLRAIAIAGTLHTRPDQIAALERPYGELALI